MQAVGYDSAGRPQYRYREKYRERKEREKFDRVRHFAVRLPKIRCLTERTSAARGSTGRRCPCV